MQRALVYGGVPINDIRRVTTDIDFHLYNDYLIETKDYELFKYTYEKYLPAGMVVTFEPLIRRASLGSVTYRFEVSYMGVGTGKLKIDFSKRDGVKLYDITPILVTLSNKLSLSAKIADRRVKDKLDSLFIISKLFPEGVEKGYLLSLLKENGYSLELSDYWLTSSLFTEKVLRSLRRFKPKSVITPLSNEESLYWVRNLLVGLNDNSIPLSAIYRNGGWYGK